MQKAGQVPQTPEGVAVEAAEQDELETAVATVEQLELHVGLQSVKPPPCYVDESFRQESRTECHGE